MTMNMADDDANKAFQKDHDTIDGDDPILIFREWLDLAHEKEINDADAMALATTDSSGLPDVRIGFAEEL